MNENSESQTKDQCVTNRTDDSSMNLIHMAIHSSLDIDSIEKLCKIQDQIDSKSARKAFFCSLSRFQSQLPVIHKKGEASFEYRNGSSRVAYTYAKIEDIAKAVNPLLFENGLSYRYEQMNEQQVVTVACIVTHKDGHEERTEMSGFADQSGKKNHIQQISSTISYLRRYTLTGALGITVSDEDDDTQRLQEQQIQNKKNSRDSLLNVIKSGIISQGRNSQQFLEWASRSLNREISNFDDLKDEEIEKFCVMFSGEK